MILFCILQTQTVEAGWPFTAGAARSTASSAWAESKKSRWELVQQIPIFDGCSFVVVGLAFARTWYFFLILKFGNQCVGYLLKKRAENDKKIRNPEQTAEPH